MNVIKNILKTIAAGIVAVGILSVIFSFYYLQPAHIDNIYGNTDYVWTSNARWFKMTEGISWGRFDADGYNNPEVVENPDIIVLGSSHTEATNVPQGKEFASLLRDKLNGKYTVYNMGISGHNFLKVCQYLPQNLERYETLPKVFIIETDTVSFTAEEIEQFLSDGIQKSPSHNTGLIAASQRLPFFAALYHQVQGGLVDLLVPDKEKLLGIFRTNQTSPPPALLFSSTPEMAEWELRDKAYGVFFDYLDNITKDYDIEIIIVLHPLEHISAYGDVYYVDEEAKYAFAAGCEENGYTFVDMTESFYKMYNEKHTLPHGFVTGKIGVGHLNADGHATVADALYEAIVLLEEEGRL